MPRRRPAFAPALSDAEAAKLKKFSAGAPKNASSLGWGAGGRKFSGCPTKAEADSSDCFGMGKLMTYHISRREVLNNLIRFKDSLLEMRNIDRGQEENGLRKYKLLINRKTGDMRFAQKISALESRISREGMKKEAAEDWKEVYLIVQQKGYREPVQFEMCNAHHQPLKPSDMGGLAWEIASEMLDFLTKKAKEIKGYPADMLIEEVVLQDLSSIHLSPQKEGIQDMLGWMGSMSRMNAEETLLKKVVGTYLLREGDEITVAIAFHFSEENLLSVHPYVLTVVEKEQKISDILLLQTDKGWTLYRDDPNLKDPETYRYFSSPQGLLHDLSPIARYPLS